MAHEIESASDIKIEADLKFGDMPLSVRIFVPASLILAIVALVLEYFFK